MKLSYAILILTLGIAHAAKATEEDPLLKFHIAGPIKTNALRNSSCWTVTEDKRVSPLMNFDANGRPFVSGQPATMVEARYWDSIFFGKKLTNRAFLGDSTIVVSDVRLVGADKKPLISGYISVNTYMYDKVSAEGIWSPGKYSSYESRETIADQEITCAPTKLGPPRFPSLPEFTTLLTTQTQQPEMGHYLIENDVRYPQYLPLLYSRLSLDGEYGEGVIDLEVHGQDHSGRSGCWNVKFYAYSQELTITPFKETIDEHM